MLSNAQIATRLVAQLPAGIFAHAARDGVIHRDYRTLEQMLPGCKFTSRKISLDQWELIGACEDGSIVTWGVGG